MCACLGYHAKWLDSSSLEMSLQTDITLQADRGEKTHQPSEQVSQFKVLFIYLYCQ